jgi:hypothetical protein
MSCLARDEDITEKRKNCSKKGSLQKSPKTGKATLKSTKKARLSRRATPYAENRQVSGCNKTGTSGQNRHPTQLPRPPQLTATPPRTHQTSYPRTRAPCQVTLHDPTCHPPHLPPPATSPRPVPKTFRIFHARPPYAFPDKWDQTSPGPTGQKGVTLKFSFPVRWTETRSHFLPRSFYVPTPGEKSD